MIIGLDALEAQRFIESPGLLHRGQGIQPHPLIAQSASLLDDALREPAPCALAAEFRPQVKPLHLAGLRVDCPQGCATGRLCAVASQQQSASRRRVVTRQLCQFLFKTLKAQADVERSLVLAEQPPDFFDLPRRFDLDQVDHTQLGKEFTTEGAEIKRGLSAASMIPDSKFQTRNPCAPPRTSGIAEKHSNVAFGNCATSTISASSLADLNERVRLGDDFADGLHRDGLSAQGFKEFGGILRGDR